MNSDMDFDFLRQKGFQVYEDTAHGLKLVKGHCEIHVRKTEKMTVMEIPVVRISREQGTPFVLFKYLLERNGVMKCPGFFAVRDGCVWYRAILCCGQKPETVALRMQEIVEYLGPKILNLLFQKKTSC